MFSLQYNKHTHTRPLRKKWVHARNFDTREQAREYVDQMRVVFQNTFGRPSDVEYRVIYENNAVTA